MMQGERCLQGRRPAGWLLAAALFLAASVSVRADQARGFILPDSARVFYSEQDIAGMSPQVLCYARNEIYARNGRMFYSAELQNYFSSQYWYNPVCSPEQFTEDMLNIYETANAQMLLERENALGGYALDQTYYSYDPVYGYIDSYDRYDFPAVSGAYDTDPDSYIFYGSDTIPLMPSDVAQLSLQELCYARNEIYARHGRLFDSEELSDYFSQKNWYWGYISPSQFDEGVLCQTELDNIWLLQAREQAMQAGGYVLDQNYTYETVGSYLPSQAGAGGENHSEYLFWDSAIRLLTEEELASLSLRELCYARNEIYARRGYIFSSQELREYFGSKTWYYGTIPAASFSSSIFNSYELANIELLKNAEYARNPSGYQLY